MVTMISCTKFACERAWLNLHLAQLQVPEYYNSNLSQFLKGTDMNSGAFYFTKILLFLFCTPLIQNFTTKWSHWMKEAEFLRKLSAYMSSAISHTTAHTTVNIYIQHVHVKIQHNIKIAWWNTKTSCRVNWYLLGTMYSYTQCWNVSISACHLIY